MRKPKKHYYFYRSYKFNILPSRKKDKLMWKDKFNSPRCERVPTLIIKWLWWELKVEWGSDDYWEQYLWLNKYCDGDYEMAKDTWGWIDYKTKESTWIDY
jgi:hypothetical protein